MNYNKTIFIAIAFGTSVRDILRTDAFKILKTRKDLKIVILASDISSPDFLNEFGGENIFFEKLVPFKPTILERFLLLLHRAALRHKSKTIDLGNTSGEKKMINIFTPLARLLLFMLGDKGVLNVLSWAYNNFTPTKMYASLYSKYNPDLVLVTRVLSYSLDYPVLRRAVFEKVPVICLVSSWDNLTSKGFFPFSIDGLVVWNEIIKDEANNLFFIPKEKIFVSGIQRYDNFFTRKGFRKRDQFIYDYSLDPNKKIITYATGSKTTGRSKLDVTSPEPDIVNFLADSIKENKLSYPSQLIIRLHPQADIEEYKTLFDRKDVHLQIPGQTSAFQDRLFSENDDVVFGETMLYSDVVINLASTITIDAALMDTPVICINFDFRGKRPYEYSICRFYDFDHYQKLCDIGGFQLSESKEVLLKDIDDYLKNPDKDKKGRRQIVEKQCHFDDGKSGERIANFILEQLEDNTPSIHKSKQLENKIALEG